MLHILIGKPGAGKGTQATLMAERLGWKVVTMGDLLRNASKTDPEVAAIVSRGDLVPEEVCYRLLKDQLKEATLSNDPIEVPEDELVRRLMSRGRKDDVEDVIKHRLGVYQNETQPVIDHYKKLNTCNIYKVDGNRSAEEIYLDIVYYIQADND